MIRNTFSVMLGLLAACVVSVDAQIHVSGSLYSSLYSSENAAEKQQSDFYQGLNLRLTPESNPNIYLQTNLRFARRGDPSDWDERVYHTYVHWGRSDKTLQVRFGRQFLYSGVLNGTMDAVLVNARPSKKLDVKLVGGLDAPFSREFDVQSIDSSRVFGGYMAYRFSSKAKLDVSYIRRANSNAVTWQQFGTALTGMLDKNLFYQAQFDYNLEKSTYQAMRYRLVYYRNRWTLSGEFNSQKPRIYEDSFFNIFQLQAFNQVRLGVTYQVGDYQLGLQELHTQYDDDSGNEIILTAGTRWGVLGVVYQNGFGGDNTGLYGEARYEVIRNLTARIRSSHYTYERRSISINEEATSFSGGLMYEPLPLLLVQAEIQESINSYYDNDVRGLFRITYRFR